MFIYLRYRGRDLPYDRNSGSLPKWLNSSGWAKLKTGACKHPGLLPGYRVQEELGPISSTFQVHYSLIVQKAGQEVEQLKLTPIFACVVGGGLTCCPTKLAPQFTLFITQCSVVDSTYKKCSVSHQYRTFPNVLNFRKKSYTHYQLLLIPTHTSPRIHFVSPQIDLLMTVHICMFSRVIHIVECINTSFLLWLGSFLLYDNTTFCLSVDEYLDHFCSWAVMNNVINTCVYKILYVHFWFF